MATTIPTGNVTHYFVDEKKGEVNELKQLLRNINVEKDLKRKRDIIKKVIAYMTLGIDVSRLFTDMIMAIETKDIVVKKMVYLYLCNYAHKQPDMAIMCINTLRRDCDNEDPMIRGFALRSLCNLRLETILEYVDQPIRKSLVDLSPYVRKTGVMGILKLYNLSPESILQGNYLNVLHMMLQDVDTSVIANVVMVLEEIRLSTGGLQVDQPMILYLLSRIGEFQEWGLNVVIDLVTRNMPSSEEEVFQIMNFLDPVLRTSNSGAILSVLRCFFHLTASLPELEAQIIVRAKPAILTMITGGLPEIQFALLKHLEIILHRPSAAGFFDDDFRQLFVRYNEPPHLKHLKVALLPLLCNSGNVLDISNELEEYATDVDVTLSIGAIEAVGVIASRVKESASDMLHRLIEFTNLDVPYVKAQAIREIVHLVKAYPTMNGVVLPLLSQYLESVEDVSAKAGIIWMLGQYGAEMIEAPYLLETVIDEYSDDLAVEVKCQLLSAAVKLFFDRPPEMFAMLARLLHHAVNDTTDQDLHDRVLFYYRLLKSDPTLASCLLHDDHTFESNSSSNSSDIYCNNNSSSSNGYYLHFGDKVFEEFNSLSVIYGKPALEFIDPKYLLSQQSYHLDQSSSHPYSPEPVSDSKIDERKNNTNSNTTTTTTTTTNKNNNMTHQITAVNVQVNSSIYEHNSHDLLDWSSNGNFSVSESLPATAAFLQNTSSSSNSRKSRISLEEGLVLTAEEFQRRWTSLETRYESHLGSLNETIKELLVVTESTNELEEMLRLQSIYTMASGPLSTNKKHSGFKCFMFAKKKSNSNNGTLGLNKSVNKEITVILLQMSIALPEGNIHIAVKASLEIDEPEVIDFVDVIKDSIVVNSDDK